MASIAASQPKRVVIAHRGASGYLPEHTLAGEAMAYGLGADFIEPDLVLTKDLVPIVLHDIQLDDTTDVAEKFPERKRADGRYYAIDLTLAEIKQLRVNERIILETKERVFPKRFPLHYSRFDVPTFEELLELVIGLNQSTGKKVGVYPELKEPQFHLKANKDIAQIANAIAKKYEKELKDAPFVWQCFDAATLKRLKTEFATKYPLVLLIEDGDLDLKDLQVLAKQVKDIASYADGIGPSLSHVFNAQGKSTQLVSLAHKNKLFVHAYTVRADQLPTYVKSLDEYLHKIFVEEDVDGIFTDFTDRVVSFLRQG